MRKLTVFEFITLNGFLSGPGGDIGWHRHGEEENQFAVESLQSGNILLFGRRTYEMMAGFWPTPMAMESDPTLARYMNSAKKWVVSESLKIAHWENTTIISHQVPDEIRRLKEASAHDITILGSGSLVTQMAEIGLIDEYQIMIDPVAIGNGTPLFQNISKTLNLNLTGVKAFKSGVVLLTYVPQ
jgi:dihydrofolate reductase